MLHYLLEVSWNPLWLRLPSVLSGTFLIWLAHRFGRALLGPAAGLAMAVLVAFSPGMLELSRVCRNYAPGFVFLLLSIHLLVRHLQTDRWRPLAAFAVVAPLAGVWHYVFAIAFLALDLVVAAELLLRRRPWRAWLAVALAHLPFVATMSFLYFTHISRMSDFLVKFHQNTYKSMLFTSVVEFTRPFQEAWNYLELAPFAEIFFGLSALGAFCLLVNGERLALLVCVVPLALAYGFSWAGQVPLGDTRHSAYLFPFLFGLVASQIPELLDGYRRTVANLRRHLGSVTLGRVVSAPGGEATRPARRTALAAPALGTVVVAIFGAAFAGASLLDYGAEKIYSPHNPRFAGRELPTWYRLEDVERGFALIEDRVGENDLVVLDFQGAFAMRMHYRVSPPDKKRHPWARQRRRVRSFSRNGVTYFYAHVGIILTPATLLEAVERVLASRRLPEPERVWTVQGSWEIPLARQFRLHFPEIPFDADVERESNGLVFAVDMKSLRAIAARAGAAAARKQQRERSP
jgi:drug/metabolite transporter superfamily protein YnfA